jgi:hypothetical protein
MAKKIKLEHDLTNPITAAVLPSKTEAMDRAEGWARTRITELLATLEVAGWNLDAVAPRGRSLTDRREVYLQKNAKRAAFELVTAYDEKRSGHRLSDTTYRVKSEKAEARFIEQSRELAAQQYDAFVHKMVAKIGAATAAKLEGSHVWGESYLTVTKPDGSREVWKTQQILNTSKLGTLFNQWPSRKVKM